MLFRSTLFFSGCANQLRAEYSLERVVLQTAQTRYRLDGSRRSVVVRPSHHRSTLGILTRINVVDAATFSVGQYRCVFESDYC